MSKVTKNLSLAGTSKEYVIIQARTKGDFIKIQGLGPTINRCYGFTAEIPISALPSTFTTFIAKAEDETK